MAERVLGLGLRMLLGLIGAAALCAGIAVGVTELHYARLGSPLVPTLVAALVAGLVVLGGILLVRGALRGRITVRSPPPKR